MPSEPTAHERLARQPGEPQLLRAFFTFDALPWYRGTINYSNQRAAHVWPTMAAVPLRTCPCSYSKM